MASKALKGLTIKIGGDTSELLDSLKDVEKKGASLSKELGEVNKLLKMDPKNTQLLAQKQKVLADSITNTKEKLDKLKEAEKQVQAQFERGEVSEEQVRALQREIIKTEGKLNSYERAVKETAEQLENMGDEADEASKELDDVGDAAEDSGDGFTIAKGAVAEFAGNALTALVSAAKDAIVSVLELAEATREYRNEMAKLDTAFADNGLSSESATKTYKELQSILGDTNQAVEAANHIAALSKNEEDLAKYTEIATGVYAKFGDSLPVEGLMEAVNETARVGQVTGPFADALNWAAKEGETFGVTLKDNIKFVQLSSAALATLTPAQKSEYEARKKQYEEIEAYNKKVAEATTAEDKFNIALENCTNEQERQELITKFLTETYSGAADQFKENNKDVIEANKANEELAATQAELGKIMEPLTQKFTELKTKALQWLIDKGLPGLQDGFNWVKDNIPSIVTAVGALTAAWLTFGGAQKLINTWNKIVAASQAALNAVQAANPIGLIIIAVTALVAAFIYLWNNCEAFREFWIKLWDGIKKAAKAVGDWFVKAWTDVGKFFSDMWKGLGKGARDAWSSIKKAFSSVTDWFKNTFEAAWEGVKNVFSTGGKIFDGIKEGIASVFTTVVNGIIRGINKVISVPFNAINGLLNTIRKVGIGDIKPFEGLWKKNPLTVPQIPELEKGGVLKKGQVGLLEGKGAEAVVPLERNEGWLTKIAQKLSRFLLDEVGGLGLERNLQSRAYELSPAVVALEGLPSKLDRILDAIEKGQILTIDGNALVGATSGKMDGALGRRRALAARGAI